VSLEEPRRATITQATDIAATPSTLPTLLASSYGAIRFPDVVGTLRVDQPWGSAQVMGAVHDASNGYNGFVLGTGFVDRLGWAAGAGVKVNLPSLGAGDSISLQGVYSVGALKYASNLGGAYNSFSFNPNNGTMGFGVATDGVDNGAGTIWLTTAWSIHGAIEHFWRPDLKTSLWVNYLVVDYDAGANGYLTRGAPAAFRNLDWSTVVIGSRTQWDVNKQLSLGAEVAYHLLSTAQRGSTYTPTCAAATTCAGIPTGVAWNVADQSEWSFRFRAQYNFVP